VSSIVKYFVAPDDESTAAVVDDGPDDSWDVRRYGNFDALTAMTEWESILTGRTFDEVLDGGGGSRFLGTAEHDDGPLLFAASPELQRALAEATPASLNELGQRWGQDRAAEGEDIDQELIAELLADVADLAGIAGTDRLLCCWWC
jgi:hypothetical protein